MSVDDAIRKALERTVQPIDDVDAVLAEVELRRVRQRRVRRSSRLLVAAAAAAVMTATGIVVTQLDSSPDRVVAGPDAETAVEVGAGSWVLPVPASGARAEQLDDGTPVWVVRHEDGSVSVLDAVSTHMPFGAGTLVGWCERSRGFEDPMHGSQFDEWGGKRGGPAPSGLRAYPTMVDGDTVVVTRPATARDRPGGDDDDDSVGAECSGSEAGDDGGTLRLHSVDRLQRVSLDQAMTRPDGAFVLVGGASILLEGDGPARVCATVWTSSPPACVGAEAPGLSLFDDLEWALLTGAFIARVRDGSLTEISFVDSYRVEASGD